MQTRFAIATRGQGLTEFTAEVASGWPAGMTGC